MITIRVWGGIGNQLFQYTFGEYLRLKTGQNVCYDVLSFGSSDKLRKQELSILNSEIPIVEDIKFSRYTRYKNRFYRFLFQLNLNNKFILEKKFKNKDILNFKDKKHYYLQGYWQNRLYPDELLKVNKDFFAPKQNIPLEIKEIENKIKQAICPVALHVRRGDYFLPKNIKIFGVCDADYYHRAIELIKQKNEEMILFVFSDDLDWVKNNLSLPRNTFFVPNHAVNPYWYIFLMSHCQHNIISNSSFSWWGAYLNKNLNKTIVSPQEWTLNSNKTIALQEWIKI